MIPIAVSVDAFTSADFWIGAGLLAAIYGIFNLGLQLNLGYTGLVNLGQTGFMALGAYAMGILVVDAGWSFWMALPAATMITVAAGLLVGLPSLRLRADYFAIATLAFSETVRLVLINARGLTGGSEGLLGYDAQWQETNRWMVGRLEAVGIHDQYLLPLLMVSLLLLVVLTAALALLQRTPWGRVLRAIREDEDAARALGKNTFSYKLQSLSLAAAMGAISGYLLALNLAFLAPDEFDALFTFLGYAAVVMGGLATFAGVIIGTGLLWALLEGTRFLDLPLASEKVAALRLMAVGAILILLMVYRPQGLLGKRQEMVLSE